ncbi:PqqD family protein [Streptococcus sp. 121]|uniref:PqqD family protein n=1 Tax=Streptococcus sp. 121 TaxID=2797637 RepID=UPI0018F062C5|nr:PqqD family protein [Streptococcus sp. 121]MBJ6746526.1 PqqD family protein [Streptococcus sp. 121]
MKIKSDFVLNKLGNQYVVVAVGERNQEFQGMIKLNESAQFLWRHLQEGAEEASLVLALQEEYGIDQELAQKDVGAFLALLARENLLTD